MSYISLTYHFIFGTRYRKQTIDQRYEKELYKFMYNFLVKRNVVVRRIGGMPDHVHILCDIPPKYAVSDVIKLLKIESSKFMKINEHFPIWEGWADGYGGFTIDASLAETRRQYIMNQRQHHSRMGFDEELRIFLSECGLEECE